MTIRAALHDVWDEHVALTRMFIISFAAGLPDISMIRSRLLQNQDAIGNVLKPYAGVHAIHVAALLRQHIAQAEDLLKAAKAGDNSALAAAQAAWQKNAIEIADMLAPVLHVPNLTLRNMLLEHLSTTTAEAVARLQGKWDEDIVAYDAARLHMLHFADFIADRLGG